LLLEVVIHLLVTRDTPEPQNADPAETGICRNSCRNSGRNRNFLEAKNFL